ncbi:MAG: 30S ribosomal protein S7 [Oligoflexia bacterium]|nr:30S ribosomal protein S7 [Oligoflexia bacterium]
MPRKKNVVKREILPDPIYRDVVLAKFVNTLMEDGKKSVAEGILYGCIDEVKKKVPAEDPLVVLRKAIENCKPLVEVKSRRVGGATYQVPVEVRPSRRQALAIRWLVTYARERSEKTMRDRLASEVIDAFNNRGTAIKKREDVHKMAEANKAFAHYRW